MNKKKYFIVIVFEYFFLMGLSASYISQKTVHISSPNGALSVTVRTNGGKSKKDLVYDVSFHGKPILIDSHLGVVLKGTGDLSEGFTITSIDSSNTEETYSVPYKT